MSAATANCVTPVRPKWRSLSLGRTILVIPGPSVNLHFSERLPRLQHVRINVRGKLSGTSKVLFSTREEFLTFYFRRERAVMSKLYGGEDWKKHLRSEKLRLSKVYSCVSRKTHFTTKLKWRWLYWSRQSLKNWINTMRDSRAWISGFHRF